MVLEMVSANTVGGGHMLLCLYNTHFCMNIILAELNEEMEIPITLCIERV